LRDFTIRAPPVHVGEDDGDGAVTGAVGTMEQPGTTVVNVVWRSQNT